MIICVFFYFITSFIVFIILLKRKTKYSIVEKFRVLKSGINFFSTKRHRIKISNAKILQIQNIVYLKKDNQTIILKNVDNIYLKEDFLYFDALGNVSILCDLSNIYKYFNLQIYSNQFDFCSIKKQALQDLFNNLFCLNLSEKINRYLKMLKDILNIKITKQGIVVGQNKYYIPLKITYKINNTIKTININ